MDDTIIVGPLYEARKTGSGVSWIWRFAGANYWW
jgi:hypothetical protein